MSPPSLPEKIVAVHGAFDGAGLPHAFGGALALAYYAEPRATADIDLNVFVRPGRYPDVVEILAPLGVQPGPDVEQVVRDGQVRLRWDRTPLDLFFAYDPVHEAMRRWARLVPFGDVTIPILAPEHLLTAKAVFDRPKDWLDIEQMLAFVPALDGAEIVRWLDHLVGPADPRMLRFLRLHTELRGDGGIGS